MPRKPPERSYDPEQTRRLLIAAALDLFAEKGFRGTSVQEVADRAGLTKGAFYHHFSTKDDVLHLIHDEFIDRALKAQEDTLASCQTATEQLARMAVDITTICNDHQKQVRIFFQELNVISGELREAILPKRRRSNALLEQVMRQGVDSGEFDAHLDPAVAALGLLGMWVWSYQWYRPDGARSTSEVARQFAVMALHSVGAREAAVVLV